jgi:hypothetical protein
MAPARATEVNGVVVRTILQTACVGLGLLSLISVATPAPTVDAAAGSWSTGAGRIDFDSLKQSTAAVDPDS